MVNSRSQQAESQSSTGSCTSHGIWRIIVRYCYSVLRRVEEGETMWMGDRPWETTHIPSLYAGFATDCEAPHKLCGSMNACQECVIHRAGNDSLCNSYSEIMYICFGVPHILNPHCAIHLCYSCISVLPPSRWVYLHYSCISIHPTTASPCYTHWQWSWALDITTSMASKHILKFSQLASSGLPPIMLKTGLQPHLQYIHLWWQVSTEFKCCCTM